MIYKLILLTFLNAPLLIFAAHTEMVSSISIYYKSFVCIYSNVYGGVLVV